MTKAELIEALSEFPDETMVVVRGWRGGYASNIEVEKVKTEDVDYSSDTNAIYITAGPDY
jgi:hypothetical protein